MTITAQVHNRSIALPADVEIPEGAEVQIMLPEPPASGPGAGPMDWMTEFVGTLDTLPADAADNHTERAHGRKRDLA